MALEFDLIENFFKPLSSGLADDEVGIGDDGAVLSVPEGHQLVVVTDTLVSGVHFPEETAAYDIAWKALAVNLSDLAAMGATPAFFSLALTLPENDSIWLANFAKGLGDLSRKFNIPLIGGDTTRGPLTVTVTANGWVPAGQAILRSGAQVDDLICVTQTLGEGALGLKIALKLLSEADDKEIGLSNEECTFALEALNRPLPQLSIASSLLGLVNSAIDISDGFVADLGHILEQSNAKNSVAQKLGAEIELAQLPLSSGVQRYINVTEDWSIALAGGDDYQLCMTVNKSHLNALKDRLQDYGVLLSVVGKINEQGRVRCLQEGVLRSDLLEERTGYSHF